MFVHTEQMKRELQSGFNVRPNRVSVIPFGINSTVPDTALTCAEARRKLGMEADSKVILFFGNIAPYKGLEYLVEALTLLASRSLDYRLVIAGRPKNCPSYWEGIRNRISATELRPYVVERIEYVPDSETEVYFKAADVLILPYTHIFQSGVLVLAYNSVCRSSLRMWVLSARKSLKKGPDSSASHATLPTWRDAPEDTFRVLSIENWIRAGRKSAISQENDIRGQRPARSREAFIDRCLTGTLPVESRRRESQLCGFTPIPSGRRSLRPFGRIAQRGAIGSHRLSPLKLQAFHKN